MNDLTSLIESSNINPFNQLTPSALNNLKLSLSNYLVSSPSMLQVSFSTMSALP
jgi:hypothetical protein